MDPLLLLAYFALPATITLIAFAALKLHERSAPAGEDATDNFDQTHRNARLEKRRGLAAARPLFERALAIREAALGAGHPDTAASLANLGLLLQEQGDLAAARPLFERALAIRETALGAGHPDTAASLANLGLLLQEQGDLPAARTLFERALAIRETALGAGHPDTAASLSNLAVLLQEQGDLAAADQAAGTGFEELSERLINALKDMTAWKDPTRRVALLHESDRSAK
jgi:tetratricopeptide (TPR) repeat protein